MAQSILLATAYIYSKYAHPGDRSARVLFGDGAPASIIEASRSKKGISSFELGSHGKQHAKFWTSAGSRVRFAEGNPT
jgi:3-oxoacyl-[acyl-carrier-protein] synthase-3